MNRRRIVIVATLLSCAGAVVAAVTAIGLAVADGDEGPTIAVGAALALSAVAVSAMIVLHLLDQRRMAKRHLDLQRDVRRRADEVLEQIRSGIDGQRKRMDAASPGITKAMLDRRLADTSFHLYRQLEARFVLEKMLEPARPLPPLRGWALSPDVAVELVDRVLSGGVRRILETGSGVSTLLFALALQECGGDGQVVALEHSEEYAAQTRRLLADHGCSDVAEVIHAPLTGVLVDDELYNWYAPALLADLPAQFDLLLIDGPPASTGPRSRFPAVPLLRGVLAPNARIFLDDAKREDEQAVVRVWIERYGAELVAMHRHDKGSAELRIVDSGT